MQEEKDSEVYLKYCLDPKKQSKTPKKCSLRGIK
jgi:hypothetical protein